jgi:hypothetical protein
MPALQNRCNIKASATVIENTAGSMYIVKANNVLIKFIQKMICFFTFLHEHDEHYNEIRSMALLFGYHNKMIYWWRKPEFPEKKPLTCRKSLNKLYHIMLY